MELPFNADGRLLHVAREDASLTPEALAGRAGITVDALLDIENGRTSPHRDLLQQLLVLAELRPSTPLALYARQVRELAAQHGLSNVRVFGSVARGEDGPDSDINLMVYAATPTTRHFFRALAFAPEATRLLGFDVDVIFDDSVGAAMDRIHATAVEL